MKVVTKKTTIGEVLEMNPSAEAVLTGFGMHCVHCPMSQMESLEEAGTVHGIDVDQMVAEINKLNEECEKATK